MLFNSYEFIYIFFPLFIGGIWLLSFLKRPRLILGWLILTSLVFYGVWDGKFLLLLLLSITVNWLIGLLIQKERNKLETGMSQSLRLLLIIGIVFNLGLLGYFKYANFLIDSINNFGTSLERIDDLILPLGISFFTFEQISYLVGIATNKGKGESFPNFLLFVTFFPHLIAGPILTADELISQFRFFNYRLNTRNLAIGFTVFAIGLFKKAVIADSVARYSSPVFEAAYQGESISMLLAWQAAIGYTLQLYFDFSGYSDMAIGLSKMVNIELPMNFFSPYKSISIGDFWRRWHISLSRFLRDYLYIPLGGSRQGEKRQYFNLIVTMSLGGLWHGANWTFAIWGILHGLFLCIDHAWRQLQKRRGWTLQTWPHLLAAKALTFLAIVVTWVIFRGRTLAESGMIIKGMLGLNGVILPDQFFRKLGFLTNFGLSFGSIDKHYSLLGAYFMIGLLVIVMWLPNVYEFLVNESVCLDVYKHLHESKPAWWTWKPTLPYAILTLLFFAFGLNYCSNLSEFLYFQF